MRRSLIYVWGGILLAGAFSACSDDEEEDNRTEPDVPGTVDEKTLATNEWIRENMEEVYFWNDHLPNIDEKKETDPEAYFNKLLYKDDHFSWITDDYASLKSEYDGDPVAMGYDPGFYTFSEASSKVFIMVNYVYPKSGAYTAGLRRGNIILKINNQELNTDNYYDLYSGDSYSVQLGKLSNGQILDAGKTLNLTSAISDRNPAIQHNVIDTLGHKIGYLAYVEFLSGKDNIFFGNMDAVFDEFKTAGVSDVIVDLRYNPGGDIDAAVHLASLIAPATAVSANSILVNLKYNSTYQKTIETKYPDELNYKMENLPSNMNLQKVYFLTTERTASASEMVISGLDPYMDVIQVGDSTYGKFYGSYVLPDDDEKWAILPIVMKYSNTEDYPDFSHGLVPDVLAFDDWVTDNPVYNKQYIYSYPLGSSTDPMTRRAIERIAGVSPASVATRSAGPAQIRPASRLSDTFMDRKGYLRVPAGAYLKELNP